MNEGRRTRTDGQPGAVVAAVGVRAGRHDRVSLVHRGRRSGVHRMARWPVSDIVLASVGPLYLIAGFVGITYGVRL